MVDKHAKPTRLLWVDLEMTGLDPAQDVILEIAAQVSDFNLQPLASYEAIVKLSPERVKELMKANDWWASYPANRAEFLRRIINGIDSSKVERDLLAIVKQEFGAEPVILAGNSVYTDRSFIKKYWPQLYQKLHYRMLDVSAFKIVMQGKFDVAYEKQEKHRAMGDIEQSRAELAYYLDWFQNQTATKTE
jgi:oligoribonuclease